MDYCERNSPEFPSFHLLQPVVLIMRFFTRVDEIQHVGTNEERTKFLEIAMFFVFD